MTNSSAVARQLPHFAKRDRKSAPPPPFFVYLAVAIAAYLALVEATKNVFYRHYDARR